MDLPHDSLALFALVFVLGAKHGLDADHLATIDGLTRHNLRHAPGRARWCGTLFSLGHGAVVMAIALAVALARDTWAVPPWMEDVGTWVSIFFLTLLGCLNLRAVWSARADTLVAPVGIKAGLFRRLQAASHPLAIAAVGTLFALSFDTMSQAALFAMTATQTATSQGEQGLLLALGLGLVFTLGMLLADGANGLWIAGLLRRADRRAARLSRIMGLMVATISLGVAGFGLARYLSSTVDGWYEGKELWVGVGLILFLALGFMAFTAFARRDNSPGAPLANPMAAD